MPFKVISSFFALIVIFLASIVVIFSLVDKFSVLPIPKLIDCFENTPAKSLNIRFVAAPIP